LEYKSYVVKSLAAKGFVEAAHGSLPDVVVFLNYGIGEPNTKVASYSIPTFGQTGVSSSNTTGTVSTYATGYGTANSTYDAKTTYTPTFGVNGHQTYVQSYDVYSRYVVLDAYSMADWSENQKLIPAFKTTITSTGTSGDLRRVFPVMIAAASEHIATSTQKAVPISIYEDDERIQALKGIVSAD
jgi:hypothetical protein